MENYIYYKNYVMDYTPYKLLDWINEKKPKKIWRSLCINPRAIYMLQENKNRINWDLLSYNNKAPLGAITVPRISLKTARPTSSVWS